MGVAAGSTGRNTHMPKPPIGHAEQLASSQSRQPDRGDSGSSGIVVSTASAIRSSRNSGSWAITYATHLFDTDLSRP
ncbi:hypothetical protein GCM10009610_20410 [Pseudonocardia xinjiangensis]